MPIAAALVYKKAASNWMDTQPILVNGDGDGTVNLRSLMACDRWQEQKWKVTFQRFNNTNHVGMLGSPKVIDAINQIILGFM